MIVHAREYWIKLHWHYECDFNGSYSKLSVKINGDKMCTGKSTYVYEWANHVAMLLRWIATHLQMPCLRVFFSRIRKRLDHRIATRLRLPCLRWKKHGGPWLGISFQNI